MDISVFQHQGKFHYMVNELRGSHLTTLFVEWGKEGMDFAIQDLSRALHFIAQEQLCN